MTCLMKEKLGRTERVLVQFGGGVVTHSRCDLSKFINEFLVERSMFDKFKVTRT